MKLIYVTKTTSDQLTIQFSLLSNWDKVSKMELSQIQELSFQHVMFYLKTRPFINQWDWR